MLVSEIEKSRGKAPAKAATRPLLYFAILLAVNLMWAFQFSGAKIATERLGPITVTLLPLALSAILLLPALALRRSSGNPFRKPAAVRNLLLLSCLGSTPAQLCLTWGVKYSLASNASVLTLTIPALTALLAAILLGERMTPLRWVSFAMAILGVVLVSDIDWRSVSLFSRGYFSGNVLILLSCFGSAFYNSYSKRVLESFSAVETVVYTFLISDLILATLAIVLEPVSITAWIGLGAEVWLSLLTIAVFSLSLSMLLFFWVIRHIDVTQASLSIYMLPVFGVITSAVVLRERVTLHLVLGGALVFVSTFLVTTYEERQKLRSRVRVVATS